MAGAPPVLFLIAPRLLAGASRPMRVPAARCGCDLRALFLVFTPATSARAESVAGSSDRAASGRAGAGGAPGAQALEQDVRLLDVEVLLQQRDVVLVYFARHASVCHQGGGDLHEHGRTVNEVTHGRSAAGLVSHCGTGQRRPLGQTPPAV